MMGYRYISEGLAEAAIVGVASNFVDPRLSLSYLAYGILCPDGITRPFDEWGKRGVDIILRETIASQSYITIITMDSRGRYKGDHLFRLVQ